MSFGSRGSSARPYDLAIVGAGGAGLTFLHALTQELARQPQRTMHVLISDDVNRLDHPVNDRTWCFWDDAPNLADEAVRSTWRRARLSSAERDRVVAMQKYRYSMVRSGDYYRLVAAAVKDVAGQLTVEWVPSCSAVYRGQRLGCVRVAGQSHYAEWVLDSRPRPVAGAKSMLWQHFTGWFVRTDNDFFDPCAATLMDWRVPQPDLGVAFGYVLPMDSKSALVEYTEFTPTIASAAHRERALAEYCKELFGAQGQHFKVFDHESGVIPMADAPVPSAQGPIVPMGIAAGAARPSSGYAFRAMQRAGQQLAADAVAGRELTSPQMYPARHRAMDAVLLKALVTGTVAGATFFDQLFTRNSIDRVLAYLDGDTSVSEDLAVMASVPVRPMLRASFARLTQPQEKR